MTTWGRFNQEAPCGTTACALGHAAMQPWANKQGVELWHEWRCHMKSIEDATEEEQNKSIHWLTRFYVDGEISDPESVAERLFGFSKFPLTRSFSHIFLGTERTKAQQLDAMRRWLDDQPVSST